MMIADKPAPVAADETPQYTALQEFRRRRWAQVLCSGALNETSLRMARRLCHEWFNASVGEVARIEA